jgi:hypothetical protein
MSETHVEVASNQGHAKEAARVQTEGQRAYQAGYDHAFGGGKLKDNPCLGTDPKWWSWNNGYKAYKEFFAKAQRSIAYEERQCRPKKKRA